MQNACSRVKGKNFAVPADRQGAGIVQGAVIVAALVVGVVVEWLPDSVFMPIFCYLPARLAAFYYSAPLDVSDLSFAVRGFSITVTRSCGGSGFFALCAALLCVRVWQSVYSATTRGRLRCAGGFVGALIASWCLAVGVNAMRIVMIVPVSAAARYVPESFRPGIHMAAGIAAFMGAFVLIWIVTERIGQHKELK